MNQIIVKEAARRWQPLLPHRVSSVKNVETVNDLPQLSDTEFRTIQRLVYDAAGIAIADTKRRLLSGRVRRRLNDLSLDSFGAYLNTLAADRSGKELTALLNVVSTNETSFFRTPAHFQWFEHTFLSERIEAMSERGQAKRLRVWSAASSSGEEAYSLAMILYLNRHQLRGVETSVVGTDLSTSVVETARRGQYSREAVAKLNPEYQSCFEPLTLGTMQVIDPVAKLVNFSTHNLMQTAPLDHVDCVFLRNVLIYFDRASKAVVLGAIIRALQPGGYLVLGPSEGVIDVPDGLVRRQSFLFQRI